jgi:hypothetical protein
MEVAQLPEHVWQHVLKVFKAWDEGKVVGQPKDKEICQTAFINMEYVEDLAEKAAMLLALANGEISFKEFKQQGANHKSKKSKGKVAPPSENEDGPSQVILYVKLICNKNTL